MTNKALIIFVKKPEAGKVKTRLGKTLGYQRAAEIYERLLEYTAKICSALSEVDSYIYHSEEIYAAEYFSQFKNCLQVDGDLGQKMNHAFSQTLAKNYERVICIGSDCISLTTEKIENAFKVLENKEYVFGPAIDGGYYLIGMKNESPHLFDKIEWSTSTVLKDTLSRLKEEDYQLLESLPDIDYEEDLINQKEKLLEFDSIFFSFLSSTNENKKISVIIPTLNEAKNIENCISELKKSQHNLSEIIVVDAHSSDNTKEIASRLGVKVIDSKLKSRAKQMNLGAQIAKSDILYFVHADVLVPSDYSNHILQTLKKGADAGCFRFVFDKNHALLKLNAFFTRFPFLVCRGGDQTLFVKKSTFEKLGGFPEDHIIMEEYTFIKNLRKEFTFKVIPENVVVSARKYDNNSYWRVQYANFLVFNMYRLGYSQEKLKNKYSKLLNY